MPLHTEDRIQQLCREAIAAKTKKELDRVIPELRAAIDEHVRLAKESLVSQRDSIAILDSARKRRAEPN